MMQEMGFVYFSVGRHPVVPESVEQRG